MSHHESNGNGHKAEPAPLHAETLALHAGQKPDPATNAIEQQNRRNVPH